MSALIVADAGPLIALGRADALELLRQLYERVVIPPQVLQELRVDQPKPGARAVHDGLKSGWIEKSPAPSSLVDAEGGHLFQLLDPGEAEAIFLARELGARLLIDERRGRRIARNLEVPILGTGAVLVAAKRRGLIDEVRPLLDRLRANGYWFSTSLRSRVLELAGEGP